MTEDNCYSNATSEENIEKNRYGNKLPSKLFCISHYQKLNFHAYSTDNFYRVRLKPTATPSSDYINASFINVRNPLT